MQRGGEGGGGGRAQLVAPVQIKTELQNHPNWCVHFYTDE